METIGDKRAFALHTIPASANITQA